MAAGRRTSGWMPSPPTNPDEDKPFLERAPWLIAVFSHRYGVDFLARLLHRPESEGAFLLLVTGYSTEDARVPVTEKKRLDEIAPLDETATFRSPATGGYPASGAFSHRPHGTFSGRRQYHRPVGSRGGMWRRRAWKRIGTE